MPSSIVDYLVYARNYIGECEQRHGVDAVEDLLDSCHALMNYGVDRYRRPQQAVAGAGAGAARGARAPPAAAGQRPVAHPAAQRGRSGRGRAPPSASRAEPQENLLYFIEKYAPLLEPWQREMVRIVRKIAQYFYPQRQTQVMNEGWATFWHYTLLNTLYDEGLLADGFMMEWLQSHTNVVFQPPIGHRAYSGINPYALGFAMFTDLRRICEKPTEEDRAGSPIWRARLAHVARLCDAQFQGRELHRPVPVAEIDARFPLFRGLATRKASRARGLGHPRRQRLPATARIAVRQYDLNHREPNIQVWSVNLRGDRSLTLRHTQHNNRPLHDDATEVLKHVARLWGFDVHLESVDSRAGSTTGRWPGRKPPEACRRRDVGMFQSGDQIQQRIESAYFTQKATYSEHLITDCVPKLEGARSSISGIEKDMLPALKPPYDKYVASLPKMQAGIESYAEKLKSRGSVKDVDQSIQEVGAAFSTDVTPESVAFEKFLVCAIPDLDKKKDIQGVLEFLADICKKDPVTFMTKVRADCGALVQKVDKDAKPSPSKTFKANTKKLYEEQQRQLQAWEWCGRKSRKGKKQLDLEEFMMGANDYIEARGEFVRTAKEEAARISGEPLPAEKKAKSPGGPAAE